MLYVKIPGSRWKGAIDHMTVTKTLEDTMTSRDEPDDSACCYELPQPSTGDKEDCNGEDIPKSGLRSREWVWKVR